MKAEGTRKTLLPEACGAIALALAVAAVPAGAGEPTLTLREALARGIERNLDLRLQEIEVPIRREDVVAAEAAFDPAVEAGLDASAQKVPLSLAAPAGGSDFRRQAGADVGLRKNFPTGLESRLAFETFRASDSSPAEALDPRYRSFLVLDLTQPLLRDRGSEVNTAQLRVAGNAVIQARYRYLDRALRTGEEIELTYRELALARQVLAYRLEARGLAEELLAGNRERFRAGVVPITEVQQAETAVAARDEQVIFARQQMEAVSTRLRDLLEIRVDDPLYGLSLGTEPLPPVIDEFPAAEEALAEALQRRPDLRERHLDVENRGISLAFQANQKLPRLDLESTLGLNGLSGQERRGENPHEGSYPESVSRLPEGDGYEWFAGLRFTYPMGNRAAGARYRQAEGERRQAVYGLKRLEGLAQTEVERALVDVTRSLERFRVAERFEVLAETTLRQEMERLREGLSDTFRVLDLQDDAVDARVRKETALSDFHKGLASLHRAMGTNLERHGIVAEIQDEETTRAKL